MKRSNQRGAALILALIFTLVLTVMVASMMFLAQSETWGTMNYQMLTQTRYGAEGGLHAAANYIIYKYKAPATTAGFVTNVFPLTDNAGNAVILSSLSSQQANYPAADVQAAFRAATDSHASNTSLSTGAYSLVDYTASAQLLSMTQVTPFGSNTPVMVQTWKVTAHGDISTVRNAESEVSAILEQQITPTFGYAAFATNGGCAALSFTGNGTTDSYDSSLLKVNGAGVATPPATFDLTQGNVGTNGNETDKGANVTINGTLSTPRVGVGACTSNNVTALTGSAVQVTGGLKELPQAVNLNLPIIPPPGTTNVSNTSTLCPTSAPVSALCPTPGKYGDINLSGKNVVTLTPGTYNINSISLSGSAQVLIAPDPVTHLYGPVILNVTGNNQATPIDLEGNGISNPTLDPSLFQISYAGIGTIKIAGNGQSAAVVYAPAATADFVGNGALFGSVIAGNLVDVGNGAIHYDRRLKKKLFTVGNYMLDSFSWSKF